MNVSLGQERIRLPGKRRRAERKEKQQVRKVKSHLEGKCVSHRPILHPFSMKERLDWPVDWTGHGHSRYDWTLDT